MVSSAVLIATLPALVAGFAATRTRQPTLLGTSSYRPRAPTLPLHVSFVDDVVDTELAIDYAAVAHQQQEQQQQQQQQQQQETHTSTFPDCLVLSWECDVESQIREELSRRHIPARGSAVSQQPYIVGVVGIPGSGKSTSCSVLVNSLADQGSLLMPFDGYHHDIATLLDWENADDAIYRRGAPDTFDVQSLCHDLERIRYGDHAQVSVPGFDHARGDPEPKAHTFDRSDHRVVVVEGLYLLHDDAGWDTVKDYLDMTIFVDADVDTCIDRLKIRNQCIPGYTKEEIERRCDVVDRTNAMTVDRSRQYADVVVHGIASKNAQHLLL